MIIQQIIKRIWHLIPVFIGISIITFFLAKAAPGDPIRLLVGDRASPEVIAQITARYGFDQPLYVQYAVYMKNIFAGDLGLSFRYQSPVLDLILQYLPASLMLMAMTILMTVPASILLASLATRHQDSMLDHAIRALSVAGIALPVFWIGIIFIRFFAIGLGWFPAGGYGEGFVQHLHHLFLPAVTLSLGVIPVLSRNLRATMLEQMEKDFILTSKAKGLSDHYIFYRQVFMNALIPNLQLFGVLVAILFGGTIVVEKVFSVPGIGLLLIDSILGRDYYVVMGLTFLFSVFTVITMLLVDIASMLIDPRYR